MEGLGRAAPAEDAVRYRLFAASGADDEGLLRRCAEAIVVRLAPLLAAYVWQRQPFRLRYAPPRGEPGGRREAAAPAVRAARRRAEPPLLSLPPARRDPRAHRRHHGVRGQRGGRVVHRLPGPGDHQGVPGAGGQVRVAAAARSGRGWGRAGSAFARWGPCLDGAERRSLCGGGCAGPPPVRTRFLRVQDRGQRRGVSPDRGSRFSPEVADS